MRRRAKYDEKTARVTLSLPEDLVAQLKILAEDDNRSVSNYVANEMIRIIEEESAGYGRTEEPTKKGESKAV